MRFDRLVGLVGLMAAVVVGGCRAGGLAEGLRCDMDCPPGQTCFNGYCVRDVPASDAAPDIDAGLPSEACGDPSQLTDGFDDPIWYTFESKNAAGDAGSFETAGGLLILSVPGVDNATYGIVDKFHLKLDEGRVFTEVLAPSGDVQPGFTVGDFGGSAHIFRSGSELIAELRDVGGQVVDRNALPFSIAAHRWFGFREEGDTLYLEVSNNGQNWTELLSGPREFWLDTAHTQFYGFVDPGGAGGTAVFDNFNGGGAQSRAGCPMSDLVEDFNNGIVSTVLEEFENECSATIIAGELHFDMATGSSTGLCSVAGVYRQDLRGDALSLRLVQAPPQDEDLFFQAKVEAAGGFVALSMIQGVIYADYCPAGTCTTVASQTYNPNQHQYFRFRESDGTLYWEASADGVSFAEIADAILTDDGFEVDFVGFAVILNANGSPSDAIVIIDDINVLPDS